MIFFFDPQWLPGLRAVGLAIALSVGCQAQDMLADLPADPTADEQAAQSADALLFEELPAAAPEVSAPLPQGPASQQSGYLPRSQMASLLDGFSASFSTASMYDSNIFKSNGLDGESLGGDTILSASPTIAYSNPGTNLTLSAAATVSYTEYLDHPDFGGFGGSGMLSAVYEGAKSTIKTSLNMARELGTNRSYDSSYVERNVFSYDLELAYRISRKTTLEASLNYKWDDASGFGGTSGLVLEASAMWRYSPLLKIGPGVRYNLQSGDLQEDRKSFGPTLRADYKLTAKVVVNAETGVDFIRYSGSDAISDEFVFVRLGAKYTPSALWSFDLSVFRDAQAAPTEAGAYRESFSTKAGVTRKIRTARLSLGVTYETDSLSATNGSDLPDPTGHLLTYDTMLSMPIFRGRSNLDLFYRWRNETGATGSAWDGYQVGFGVSTKF
jgi:hypothetical protein